MKSFTYKALALAAASVCGTASTAATLAVTNGKFAVETMTSTTLVTVPNMVLTMGVGRTAAQDFTVIVKPVGGTKFTTASCSTTLPVFSNTVGAANITLKRASTTECAYEVDVTAPFAAADAETVTFANLVMNGHGLATVGATESVTVGIWDLGETARIDTSADLSNVVARSYAGVTLTATADTGTTTNVDDTAGPLFGFVVANDDIADTAEANFVLNINGTLTNAGGTAFSKTDLTKISLVVTGDFDGLQTNFTAGNSNVLTNFGGGAPTVTVAGSGASTTASFNLVPAQLAASGDTTVNVFLQSLRTKSLGTSRSFGVSGTVDAVIGADRALAGNAAWWVWGANAMELRSAFFNNDTDGGNFTRFFFQNTGSSATYSATCHAETGVTVTYGTAKTGSLVAGVTAMNAKDVCTFSTGKRGAVTFTINAPAANVKGVYQQAVNGLSAGYIALERPYLGKTY